jgi:hypothetical protein
MRIGENYSNVVSPDYLWCKMTPASYDDAMRYVRRQSRISTNSLADSLGIRWSLALDYLEEMKRRGIVGDMQEDGWWPVLRKEAFSAPRKPAATSAKKTMLPPLGSPSQPERMEGQGTATPLNAATQDRVQQLLMEKLQEALRALAVEREKNQKLSNNCRLLVAEREAWRHRALAAEMRVATGEEDDASQERLEALYESPPDEAPSDAKALSPPEPFIKRLLPRLESLGSK